MLLPACATIRKGGAHLAIVSASYGTADRRVNVTDAVRSLVIDNQIRLRAPWALGLVDPAFGSVKDVCVVYRMGHEERTAAFTQQQDIILP